MAKDWVAHDVKAVGVLLIDDHVRVYHGRSTKLPHRYVIREKLCLRGTTDYWVNALDGARFFCVTKDIDPDLQKNLEEEILPRLLNDIPGKPTPEELAERGTRLTNGLRVREIGALSETGHQTAILSTDYRSELARSAATMFARWNQENFFKYMREPYGLDRLVEHGISPILETTRLIHLAWRTLDSQIRRTAAELNRAHATFAAPNPDSPHCAR